VQVDPRVLRQPGLHDRVLVVSTPES
jgi:hypothetical protein